MPSVLNKKRILQRVTKLFNLARSVSSPGKMQFCSKYLPSPSFETGYYLQHNLQGSRMLCSNHTSSWKPMHAHRAVTHAFPLSPTLSQKSRHSFLLQLLNHGTGRQP